MPKAAELETLTRLAERLADTARQVILPYFRQAEDRLETAYKADSSPVTAADRAAEQAMRDILSETASAHGIIGEEFGVEGAGASHQWVLDPIDGTKAFAAGRPLFGTLIALMIDGRPVIGVIDQTATGDRWIGVRDEPTRLNGRPCFTRRCAQLADAWIASTAPDMFRDENMRAKAMALHRAAAVSLWGGDCINYGLLSAGRKDAVIEDDLKLHDFAALVPVIEGAGGLITDWQGKALGPDSEGNVLATGAASLHAEAVRKLNA